MYLNSASMVFGLVSGMTVVGFGIMHYVAICWPLRYTFKFPITLLLFCIGGNSTNLIELYIHQIISIRQFNHGTSICGILQFVKNNQNYLIPVLWMVRMIQYNSLETPDPP